ncbi:MAG: hypothetical protein AB7P76_06605 [Candidatus Melainabacteria bacterium]
MNRQPCQRMAILLLMTLGATASLCWNAFSQEYRPLPVAEPVGITPTLAPVATPPELESPAAPPAVTTGETTAPPRELFQPEGGACAINKDSISVGLSDFAVLLTPNTTKEEFLVLVPDTDRQVVRLCDEGFCEVGYRLLPGTEREMTLTFRMAGDDNIEKISTVRVTGSACTTREGIRPGDPIAKLVGSFPVGTYMVSHGIFGEYHDLMPDNGYYNVILDETSADFQSFQASHPAEDESVIGEGDQYDRLLKQFPQLTIKQLEWNP